MLVAFAATARGDEPHAELSPEAPRRARRATRTAPVPRSRGSEPAPGPAPPSAARPPRDVDEAEGGRAAAAVGRGGDEAGLRGQRGARALPCHEEGVVVALRDLVGVDEAD